MSEYGLKVDLKKIVLQQSADSKRQAALRRIIEFVFAAKGPEFERRLGRVLAWLEATYWQKKATKAASVGIIHAICAEIYARKDLDIFLQFFLHRSLNRQAMQQARIRRSQEDLRSLGWNWFRIEFFRFTGETLDRSVDFALHLLEKVGRWHQKLYAHMTEAGAGEEAVKRACTAVQPDSLTIAAQLVILSSCFCAPHYDIPQKRWVERLLEHAASDGGVEEVLGAVLNFLSAPYEGNRFPSHAISEEFSCRMIVSEFLTDGDDLESLKSPKLLLGDRHYGLLQQRSALIESSERARETRGKQVLDWMKKNAESILLSFEEREKMVRDAPRHGFRPGGFDHIDITVSALWSAGLRGIIFHPEGQTFPDVGVELLIRKETPHLVSIRTTLSGLEGLTEEALANGVHLDLGELKALLAIVVHDAAYRIILNDRQLREKKRDSQSNGADKGPAHPVRPHLRRLVMGQHASEEARDLGKEVLGYSLPEGLTFVRAHYSHGRIEYDLPTTAFATYGDDDLFEIGGNGEAVPR